MKVGGFGVEWIFIFLHKVSEEYMCGSGARPHEIPKIGNLMRSTSVKNGVILSNFYLFTFR